MEDKFDTNWASFTDLKNGTYYSKRNDDRFNCYETHHIEFSLGLFLIQIEIYIQLLPANKSYSTFLERFTKLRIKSKQIKLTTFQIEHKSIFNRLINLRSNLLTGNNEFDKKYKLKVTPPHLINDLFNQNSIDFFLKKKIISGSIQYIENQNVISFDFPEIIYQTKDIESLNRLINKIIETLSPIPTSENTI